MNDITALVKHLQNIRLVLDYTFVSAVALLIYDYALTLHLEIKFVWFAPWNCTKVLFLFIRYISFVDASLFIINRIFVDLSPEFCGVSWPLVTWFVILRSCLSQVVLSISTWAVWHRHKAVGILLLALMAVRLVLVCIFTFTFVKSMEFAPPLYPGYRGCFITKAGTTLWATYVVGTASQAVILALMLISASKSYQPRNIGELSHVVYRDGVLFYFYLLCIPITSLTTVLVFHLELTDMLLPLQDTLYSIFTARVILNIREVSHRGLGNESHTNFRSSIVFAMPDLQSTRDGHYQYQDSISLSQPPQEKSQGGDANDMHVP